MSPIGWPIERELALIRLWKIGLSASAIAERLGSGVTRNAVIGKLNRLGLRDFMREDTWQKNFGPSHLADASARPPRPSKPVAIIAPAPVAPVSPEPSLRVSITAPKQCPVPARLETIGNYSRPLIEAPTPCVPPAQVKRVTLFNRQDHQCANPVSRNKAGMTLYCGAQRALGSPYCAPCDKIIHEGPRKGPPKQHSFDTRLRITRTFA